MTRRAPDRPGAVDPESGTTLVEVLVVLAIVAILAATAIPFSQTTMQRRQEIALQDTLRTARTAIDAFHDDWLAGRFEDGQDGISDNGYPEDLDVLVSGMKVTTADGTARTRRYLRRLPGNPFAGPGQDGWRLVGYAQTSPGASWDRVDVYDLRATGDRKALNGTALAEW